MTPELAGLRILVIDDDDFTRVLLERTLLGLGYHRVSSVATAAQAAAAVGTESFSAAVIDLDLGPGPSGVDLARHLRRVQPQVGIVILSSYADPRIFRADTELPDGAFYLSKQAVSSVELLQGALRLVIDSPHDRRNRAHFGDVAPSVPRISDNQWAIMRLIAEGLNNAEIARRVSLTEAGVGKAVSRLIKQLGIEANETANQRVLIAQCFYSLAGKGLSGPGA